MRHVEVMRSVRWSFSRFRVLPLVVAFTLGLLCAGPVIVSAEEPAASELTDKLMLRGGWAYVFGATANV